MLPRSAAASERIFASAGPGAGLSGGSSALPRRVAERRACRCRGRSKRRRCEGSAWGAQLGARSGAPGAPRVSRSGAPPAAWRATVRGPRCWCAARSSLGSVAGGRCGSRRQGGPPGHRRGGRAARRGRGGGRRIGGGAPAAREDPEVEILELIADGASQAEEVRPAALDAELLEGAGREVAVCGGLTSVEQDGHEHLESKTCRARPALEWDKRRERELRGNHGIDHRCECPGDTSLSSSPPRLLESQR